MYVKETAELCRASAYGKASVHNVYYLNLDAGKEQYVNFTMVR